MKTFYEKDTDTNLIKNKKVAIFGYGSQGHAHALNLKDSGVKEVVVALREGSSSVKKAESEGLKVMSLSDAAAWADVVMMLTPDELQSEIYKNHIEQRMKEGTSLAFAHGLLAVALTAFSFYMVISKPFFKFRSIKQILTLTIGGFIVFAWFELEQFSQYSPLTFILLALYLQIPVVIGGVLHMMLVARNNLNFLAKPIHKQWFGANKTWRGVIAVPVLTALGGLCLYPLTWVSQWLFGHALLGGGHFMLLGFVAGVGYILGELPNSFFKRRMGIGAGEVPQDKKYWFIALDQLDSAIGVALAYWLVFGITSEVVWLYIITFPITALLVKQWLYSRNLKASAV